MTVRRISLMVLIVAALMFLGGCSRSQGDATYPIYQTQGPRKIGVVVSVPEKSDAVLNNLVFTQLKDFAVDHDIEYEVLEPGDFLNNEEALRYLAENEYDLIIALGQDISTDLDKVAPDYPGLRFALLEGKSGQPNVTSMVIGETDGAFLAGAACAALSRNNLVGWLGEQTGDEEARNAFARGVEYLNRQTGKKIRVLLSGSNPAQTAGGDYQAGYDMANRLYWSGADVVYGPAARYSGGLSDSARRNKKIALMRDQGFLQANPWNIYGAIVTHREKAIQDLLEQAESGKLTGGVRTYGVAEGVIDLVTSEAVPVETKDQVTLIMDGMKTKTLNWGGISLPDDLLMPLVDQPPAVTGQTGRSGNATAPGNAVTGNAVTGDAVTGDAAAGDAVTGDAAAGASGDQPGIPAGGTGGSQAGEPDAEGTGPADSGMGGNQ